MHEYALNEREKNKNIVQIQLLGIIDDRKLKTIWDGDDMEEVERKSEGRGRNRKESGGGVFVFERRFCCLLCLALFEKRKDNSMEKNTSSQDMVLKLPGLCTWQ